MTGRGKPVVDHYKRFMFAHALAPVFAGEWLRVHGRVSVIKLAQSVVLLADALARAVDRRSNEGDAP